MADVPQAVQPGTVSPSPAPANPAADERLIQGAAYRDIDMITKALDDGANVNAVSGTSSSTALHALTAVGRPADNGKLLPIADLLISRGANVNVKTREGMTPLMWAVLAGNIEMMKRLLDAGADITIKHSNGQTALDMAREDFPQGVRLLEERQAAANPITALASAVASAVAPAPAPALNPDEDPKLLVAVLRGDIEGVRAALAAGADVNTTGVNSSKNTPLHHAVISHVDFREKMYPIVDLLLEKGANVNAQRSGDGHTPFTLSFHDPKFFYALFQKRPDLTLKIKEAPQNREETPLQYATRRFAGRPEKRYISTVIAKAELGEWDGAIAIAREEADIPAPASPVAVQSAVAPSSPSAPVSNSDHDRALQAAVAANDDAAARAAILAGANPNLMINGNQETMLIHYAATENRPMVEFLLDHGADVNGRAGPAADEPGWTALNYSRYFDVGEYIEERGGLTARLLDASSAASQINFPPAPVGLGPRSGEQRLQGREDLIIPPITLVEGYATGESDGDSMDAIDVKEVYVAKLGRTLTLDQFFRKYMGDGAVFKVGPKFYGIPRKDLLKEYLEGSAIAYECTKTFAMDGPRRGTFEYSDIYAEPYYALRTPAGVLYVSLSIMRLILGTTHAFFKLDDKPAKKLENIASRSSVIAGGPVSSQLHCQAGSDGNVYTIRFFKLPEIEEEEETDEEDEPNVVFVKKGEDKTEFPLDLSHTVLQLKEAVKEKLGIAVEAQKMVFQGKVLKDDQTLGEANVKKGYTIQLQVSGGRKFTRKQCKKFKCKDMGFTQKASCRPYKNCYKSKKKPTKNNK